MGLIIVDDTERVLFGKATKKVIRQILAMVVCVMVIGNADYRMSASDVRYKENQQSVMDQVDIAQRAESLACLLYTSTSQRDRGCSRMQSSA